MSGVRAPHHPPFSHNINRRRNWCHWLSGCRFQALVEQDSGWLAVILCMSFKVAQQKRQVKYTAFRICFGWNPGLSRMFAMLMVCQRVMSLTIHATRQAVFDAPKLVDQDCATIRARLPEA